VANALRYAPQASTVTVAATLDSAPSSALRRATVEVTDEGPGFSAELLPVAFERFRREDKARTRGPARSGEAGAEAGSGLGLAIVRNVMRGHGGDAEVFNRQDRSGARVRLSWPVPAEAAASDEKDLGR
jgi:signal transduction histidine kinase